MTVHFEGGVFLYVILNKCGNIMVKMINLSAVGAFDVKMTFAFFVIDKLIKKASAVTLDCSVNKTFFNQLCHKTVCCALADFVLCHVVHYFFNRKSFFAVCHSLGAGFSRAIQTAPEGLYRALEVKACLIAQPITSSTSCLNLEPLYLLLDSAYHHSLRLGSLCLTIKLFIIYHLR